MDIQTWFNKCNGKSIEGGQCVGLVGNYIGEVLGNPRIWGNAVDHWTNYQTNLYTRIPNGPSNYPQLGDIIVWGTAVGQYGHVAVCKDANVYNFKSFDQNWPEGSNAHFQDHNYWGLLGWLRPNKPVTTPVVPPEVPHTPEMVLPPVVADPEPEPEPKPTPEPNPPEEPEGGKMTLWEAFVTFIINLWRSLWQKN